MVVLILIVIVLVALPLLPEIMHVITWFGSWMITGSERDPLADPDPSDATATNQPQCGRCGHCLTKARANCCPGCGVLFIDGGIVAGAVRKQLVYNDRSVWRRPAMLLMLVAFVGSLVVAAARIVSPGQPERKSIFTPESVEITTSSPTTSKPNWRVKFRLE